MDNSTLKYYQENAKALTKRYNGVVGGISEYFNQVFTAGSKVLDVGCGSGRDLNQLLKLGFQVTGVDPCEALIELTKIEFPKLKDLIHHDALPELKNIADKSFDGILCSAVLMHLPKEELFDAAFSLRRVLREDGSLLVSIPNYDTTIDPNSNRDENNRLFNGLTAEELQLMLERLGFRLIEHFTDEDSLRRSHRQWATMWFKLDSNNGSRSLNRIEAVLNKDKKVATYKPALFRALSDIAQVNYNVATWHHGGIVSLPISEISLKWINYYWPIFEYKQLIPQTTGGQAAFRRLMTELIKLYNPVGGLAAFIVDLRSNRLSKEVGTIYKKLLTKLNSTISQNPVKYSGGSGTENTIFSYNRSNKEVEMPADIWRELSIMGKWVSDSTILRWAELTNKISKNSIKTSTVIDCLLTEVNPERDVFTARKFYNGLLNKECVWSCKPIDKLFAVDHAIPFAHWRNNDLWNLLPADPKINGQKSDKLPTQHLLKDRKDCIVDYWEKMHNAHSIRFEYESNKFAGKSCFKDQNWKNKLYSSFQEAIEFTARQRGLERWQTDCKQATGSVITAIKPKTLTKPDVLKIPFLSYDRVEKQAYKTSLPLVGQFAAGRPFRGFDIDSLQEAKESCQWIEVPAKHCNAKSFIIQVIGDSMEPTIMKGDYLVCEYHRHRQANHNIVIMGDFSQLSSGEEAIKRIHETVEAWHFKSDNPKYEAIFVKKEEFAEYPILGTVVYNLSKQELPR